MNSTQLRQMIADGLRNQVTHHCGMFIRNPANVGVREQLEKMIAVLAFVERVAKEPAHFMSWGMVPIGKTVSALHVAMDRISHADDNDHVQTHMDYAAEWAIPKPLDAETARQIREEGTVSLRDAPRRETMAEARAAIPSGYSAPLAQHALPQDRRGATSDDMEAAARVQSPNDHTRERPTSFADVKRNLGVPDNLRDFDGTNGGKGSPQGGA